MRPVLLTLILFLVTLQFGVAQKAAETPQEVSVCQLLSDPNAWNHKLVQVTGFASHGFEDSAFFDPQCEIHDRWLWMEFGGTRSTGTVSTASSSNRSRPTPAVVEGIEVPLVDDTLFHHFDDLLHQGRGNLVHATVIGRFFAGREENLGGKFSMGGYGHLGCCSLFMIQQVLAVDDQRDPNLDYDGEPEQPNWKNVKCVADLAYPANEKSSLNQQRLADEGQRVFAFTETDLVAQEFILSKVKAPDYSAVNLKEISATPARMVYSASVKGSKVRYMIVLHRPYWLSFYAADHKQVIWVVMAAWASCD